MLEENMRKAMNTLKSREALPNCDSRREDVGVGRGGREIKLHYETLYIKTVESN